MRKYLSLCLALLLGQAMAHADEGMWLLKMMEQQHLVDSLRKAGLQLPPSALYNENGLSLRDCIGIFGNGCTGELVSADGLVLTNNHCGFSYVHAMSTMDHNYLQDGYFAKSRAEELRTPDLTFTFVVSIVDVTDEVNAAATAAGADVYTAQSQNFLEPLAAKMLGKSEYRKRKGMLSRIVPFFGANKFYLFYEQKYSDVRLVVNPPLNIGQFGGNSDNWMWPRQNADFALFRIYADKNGQPADYSEKNVPLHVNKFLPIRLGGFDRGDYTMIMGFPGSTSRYLTAAEVEMRTQKVNLPYILAGNPHLDFLKEQMDANDSIRLQLQDDYMHLGNVVKNFGGMNQAVERIGLVAEKRREEAAFRTFAAQSGCPAYANVIERIDSLCQAGGDYLFNYNLVSNTLAQQKLRVPGLAVKTYVDALKSGKKGKIAEARQNLLAVYDRAAGSVDLDLDRRRMELLVPLLLKYKKPGEMPSFVTTGAEMRDYYNRMYDESVFTSRERLEAVLAQDNAAELLENDILVQYDEELTRFMQGMMNNHLRPFFAKRAELQRIYVGGLCEMYDWSKAPDANFTLRMTYGHVCDMKPRDGVIYDWRTVLGGMFEKESKTESDYFVNERLRTFYEQGNYGRYAREDGQLPTCFLSNNDITGGNSGSGVFNARGELIGLAFDGNIESLSSDLKFNPALQRCINVDMRYVLFIIDTFGGSTYAVDEMDVRQ